MHDTTWLRRRIVRDFGSLDCFSAVMRAERHSLITVDTLEAMLAGRTDAWTDEAMAMAAMLQVPLIDVLASLHLARIDHRFAMPQDDQRLELVS